MARRIVVVLSTVFKARGGIPRFNQMLCLALDEMAPRLDLDVTVLSQDDSLDDYRGHSTEWRHARFIPGGGQLKLAARTLRTCINSRPDLLLIGLIGMTPVGLICRPWLRRGFGFIAHGVEAWSVPRWSRRFSARRARFAFAVSDNTRHALVRSIGLPLDAVWRLPNTLEPGFDLLSGGGAGANDDGPAELLTVARLDAGEGMKGVDQTLEAVARLVQRHPDLRYCIVGKGSDRPRLQALASSLQLDDHAVFLQDLSDEELAETYRGCSVFVMPSGQEGFGIVFLEAMKFAKPCIGGAAGGTPEVIDDGRTGLLVPYGDVDALESALERLILDGELRRRMGLAGRKRLEEEFVFERFRARLEGYLTELLGPAAPEGSS